MFEIDKSLSRPNIPRTIRFTEELFDALLEISEKEEISFNSLVLQCCNYALSNYKNKEDKN
jgi:predicted DNA-binding ribbon-helix-helix protein